MSESRLYASSRCALHISIGGSCAVSSLGSRLRKEMQPTNASIPHFAKCASQPLHAFAYCTRMVDESLDDLCRVVRIKIEGRVEDMSVE